MCDNDTCIITVVFVVVLVVFVVVLLVFVVVLVVIVIAVLLLSTSSTVSEIYSSMVNVNVSLGILMQTVDEIVAVTENNCVYVVVVIENGTGYGVDEVETSCDHDHDHLVDPDHNHDHGRHHVVNHGADWLVFRISPTQHESHDRREFFRPSRPWLRPRHLPCSNGRTQSLWTLECYCLVGCRCPRFPHTS